MEIDQGQIDSLIQSPSESLNVELKRWIDPATSEGQTKIVKGCLALRNRNGGYLVIGFDDKTLQPDLENQPQNPREQFHVDKIQSIVSKYAQDLFEVGVAFPEREGVEYPVIVIPSGVRVPVSTKKELVVENKRYIEKGAVYFRTLSASGIVSTSSARPDDWSEIFEICFENREADIGRFLRRQLSPLDGKTFAEAMKQFLVAGGALSVPQPSLYETTTNLLEAGSQRFQSLLAARKSDSTFCTVAGGIAWHVALTVSPSLPNRIADKNFLAEVLGSNPRLSGWPVWIDSRGSAPENRPYREAQAWEALIQSRGGLSIHLDFWRIEPNGSFYLRRSLQDDLTDRIKPGVALDPILVLLRVAEAIAVGLTIVKSLVSSDETDCRLGFAFKWTNLSGRKLFPWANPGVFMIGEPEAGLDEVTTYVDIPLDSPLQSIGKFVHEATRELFAVFDGEIIPQNVVEQWTQKLINRQL